MITYYSVGEVQASEIPYGFERMINDPHRYFVILKNKVAIHIKHASEPKLWAGEYWIDLLVSDEKTRASIHPANPDLVDFQNPTNRQMITVNLKEIAMICENHFD